VKTDSTAVKLVRTIQASPEMIWAALTQASGLREWMCDGARSVPRKGGLIQVWWNSGYEARGVFTAYQPPGTLAFTWNSPMEPDETSVKFTLKPVEGGTRVTVIHSGFGTGKKWAGRAQESQEGWTQGLDNLQSTLETGVDLRQMDQPRLGLGWETALGETGAVVTAVMPGGPCEQAGLCQGDVIVSFAGRKVRNDQDLMATFRSCRAGQRVKLIYLRAGKRRTTTVELIARPVPEIPDDPVIVVEQARQAHERALAALRTSVMMLTDEQAGLAPESGEWSVKQVLAHLSASERGFQAWAVDVLQGNETEGVEGRLPEQFAAVFASAPTVGSLLDRFERDLAESRAMVAAFTWEHRAHRARYWQIAQMLLHFQFHTEDHLRQIQATVRAVANQ
jgi:uncharacterized protein YndB with AHSA1/START domain/uncharacterized damage-inducible protein DinB